MHRIPLSYPIFSGFPVCRQHSPLYDAFSLFYTRSVLSPLYAFSSLFSCRFPCPALQRPAGYYFSAKVTGRSNLANAGCAASEAQNLPLRCRAYFSLQPCPIVPATFKRQKIIPEAANRPNKGKQTRLNYELQQIKITGGKRGSHCNGNESPYRRPTSH